MQESMNAEAGATRVILPFESVSAWKWHYQVFSSDDPGTPVAEVSLRSVRNQATIRIGEVTVEIVFKGWFAPAFSFRTRGREIAAGKSVSGFRTRFTLASDGRHYEMRPRGLGSTFNVSERGEVLGTIRKNGILSRSGQIVLDRRVPTHDGLFLLVLAAYYWRMIAAAAS